MKMVKKVKILIKVMSNRKNKLFLVIAFICISTSISAQSLYDKAIHYLIENKLQLNYCKKFRLCDSTSGYDTHYFDVSSFVTDSSILKGTLNKLNTKEVYSGKLKLKIPNKVSKKNKACFWTLDNFTTVDNFKLLSGNLKYYSSSGGAQFLIIFRNDSIVNFYHGGYPH